MGLNKPLLNALSDAKRGPQNLITDVAGITVGHKTLKTDRLNTGVTVIKPCQDNIFRKKMPAAVHVINGFGKSTGIVQINELGTLETPIVLTNTLSVGTAYTALVKHMLKENPEIGTTTGSVNPVVMECNDSSINHIRDLGVTEDDVNDAFAAADTTFAEGPVGSGTGMRCYQLKGGIGSASRQVTIDGHLFTMGALVMSNFGSLKDLTIYGKNIGQKFDQKRESKEKGSIITIIATDIPFNSRQLKRIARRSSVGITRSGSFTGNGSGEITLAFSTANRVSHFPETELSSIQAITDDKIDRYFRITVDIVNEAILSSLAHGRTFINCDGKPVYGLPDALNELGNDPDAIKLKQQLGL
ncbi:P1 family peptidase [Lactobacillus sp. ESL0731]|uniref:P1 family peptidase n=1 Tax=unclassified Lactobacillus TaxID=2620435 RepID=UPI0023F81BC3|nr:MULTISPECIES: P1 family peptidase [unclassified Lactobacillus]WEV51025.1 P1 family peptidase [Lactobacillus sp. ESL0700]WEV62156.1 P1 family peptidase [Lactobacillus sp. ESL0731]